MVRNKSMLKRIIGEEKWLRLKDIKSRGYSLKFLVYTSDFMIK